ncbi:MAG TPA: MFS transporter [Azospirillaceae bacterium]|nr:MFS transporter [Azospirillaceae bacterium]
MRALAASLGGWAEGLRGLPPGVWVIVGGAFLGRCGSFVVPFLMLFLTGERGANPATAGLVVAAFGAGSVVGSLVGGTLADRIGRKPVMVGAMALSATVMPWIPTLDSLWAIGGALALIGGMTDMYRPASSAAIGDMVGEGQRVRAFGLIYWAANLGSAIAPVLGGALAVWGGHKLLYWSNAAVFAVYAVLLLVLFRESRPERAAGTPAGSGRGGLRAAFADPVVWSVSGGSFLCASLFFQAYTTLPLAMRAAGFGTTDYGIAVAMNGLAVVAFSLPVAALVAGMDPKRVLTVGGLLMGGGVALTGLAGTVPAFAAIVVLWTIGEILTAPVAPAVLSRAAPPDRRGAYQATLTAAWSLAAVAGPVLGGLAIGLHPQAVWIGCGVVGLLAAACFAALPRRTAPGGLT